MPADRGNTRICVIGHLVGRNPGYITTQGQILADLLKKDGFIVTSISSRISRVARLAEVAITILTHGRSCDLAIVEVYSGKSMILADLSSGLCKALSVPIVMVLHGGNLPNFVDTNPRWTNRVFHRAAALVAPSDFLAQQFGRRGYQVSIISNVVEVEDKFHRTRFSVKPRLMWMRSFHSTYNPQMAVNVLRDLVKHYPDATLVMAGVDKGLMDETKKHADMLGLSNNISFPGFLDQKAKLREFAASDIFINTNHIDNMPVSVLEAAAHGLVIVATDVGGLRNLITDGTNGLLVPDGDVEAMSAAIRKLISEPKLAEKFSQNGLILARTASWRRVREVWLALFEELRRDDTADLRTDEVRP